MPHVRPASTQSSSMRPETRPAMANENGTAMAMSPVMMRGGWMNMPGCVSRGLMPMPSTGGAASVAKGSARKSMTARKKTRMSMSTPLA